jgi:hypothetical protein
MQKNDRLMFVSKEKPGVARIGPMPLNERHEAIRKDIATRLRASCIDLSDEAFADLVDKMLKVQIANEARWH